MNTSEIIALLEKVQALLQQLAPVGTTDEKQVYADLCYDYASQLATLVKQIKDAS